MINSAIPQTGSPVSTPIPSLLALRNPFLAVNIDVSIGESGVKRLPACSSRRDNVAPSEQILRVVGYGEMTAANCHQFRKTACAAWHGQTDVEIDLSETKFIDCAGLGALIAVRNLTSARNGVARLMNPTSSVQQMLDLTRTGQLFEIVSVLGARN